MILGQNEDELHTREAAVGSVAVLLVSMACTFGETRAKSQVLPASLICLKY